MRQTSTAASRVRRWIGSLSSRLLVLTLFFVMVAEILIYVPSIARFRVTYLEDRIATAQLASLALTANADGPLTPKLEQDLLDQAEIFAIVLKRAESRVLILGENVLVPDGVSATFDLRDRSVVGSVSDAFVTMVSPNRTIRVIGQAIDDPATLIDVVIAEQPLRTEMFAFSRRVLGLSLLISVFTGALVFLALHVLIVRPLRHLTQDMTDFRKDPEGAPMAAPPGGRGDEIGIAQREFAAMQDDLRNALRQKSRLAELGTAVSKISHDLRNILATAQLVSDRLSESADPEVRRTTPVLLQAIDRAIWLCTQTLQVGRIREQKPQRTAFPLREIVDDVGVALGLDDRRPPLWLNQIPSNLLVSADREQLFRVFMNLGRNAMEALSGRSDAVIAITAATLGESVVIEFADNGPGIPEDAHETLFRPFAGTTKSSGTGLGLAIAKDLLEGHGGSLTLHRSDATGTTFRMDLPANVIGIAVDRIDRQQTG
jgi:signal transduction histidine kinase